MWSFVKEVNVEMCGDDILSQVAAVEKQCGLHPGPTKKEMAGRVDCHPESGVTPDLCEKRGCVWGKLGVEGPWCNFRNYTAPPQFDLSSEDLKAAAEMFIYFAYCPLSEWYAFYRNLFRSEPPNHIILTLNRMSQLETENHIGMNQKLLQKGATLMKLKYKEIQSMLPQNYKTNISLRDRIEITETYQGRKA